jgi:DNA topoisomerase-1
MDALKAGLPSNNKLMIVESKTKAKEIKAFLGAHWTVLASNGFIKETIQPKNVPEDKKKEYGRYGIRTSDFDEMLTFVPRGFSTMSDIRKALKNNVDVLVISTDPDRAGDAIGMQIVDTLRNDIKKSNIQVLRASWHEITKTAVIHGLQNASDISAMEPGNNADRSRSVYDRLFGYSVSPFLWKAVASGTSGGRAQSPALRIVVNREKERMAFVSSSYYGIEGVFTTKQQRYAANLISIDDRKVATGTSFDSDGKTKKDVIILDDKASKTHIGIMRKSQWHVDSISEKAYRKTPPKPYKTSTFQQDVGTRLGMSSKAIMQVAQRLFENAVITYLRTDAEVMSQEGVKASRTLAQQLYGKSSVPTSARIYKAKGNAQEGHEAIRPVADETTGLFPSPQSIKTKLDRIDKKAYEVYDLIYRRSIASQMNDAVGKTITISLKDSAGHYLMNSVGTRLRDLGWMVVMKDSHEDHIPDVDEGDKAQVVSMSANEHKTIPPARYTEPQLVARLEELGIGRPATYSQIVSVNQERGYIAKRGKALYPTWRGMQVASILENKLRSFVDYGYTSDMEKRLDDIQNGVLDRQKFLEEVWHDIDSKVNNLAKNIDYQEINALSVIDLNNGYIVKCQRSGCWLEEKNQKPDDKGLTHGYRLEGDELYDGMDAERCKELMTHVSSNEPRKIGTLQDGAYKGYEVTIMHGKYGAYAHAAKGKKTVNVSIPDTMDDSTATMDDVSSLFTEVKIPRQLGEGYFVGIGKRGAWIGFSKGKTRRARAKFVSMPDELDPHTITLDEAKTAFAQAGSKK